MKKLQIAPFIFAAIAARLVGFSSTALWYDESFSLHQSHLPVNKLMAVALLDFTPPLWELLLHWVPANPLWLIRLPSLVFGLLSLLAAWELMRALYFTLHMRVISLAVMAILPGLIWTSQDARVYAFFMFLYITGALFTIRANWAAVLTVNLLMLYSHATAPVYVAALVVFGLWHHPRHWKAILFAAALPGLLYLPWLSVLAERTHDYWQTPLTLPQFMYSAVMAFFVNAFPNDWAALITAAFLLGTGAMLIFRLEARPAGILVTVPLAGMVVTSLLLANVIVYRTLMPLLITFVIWFIAGVWGNSTAWVRVICGAWALALILIIACFTPTARGGDLDKAADQIAAQWQPGDVIYFGAGTALPVADYLSGKPVYLLDELQHPALLNHQVGIMFGMKYAALENIPHRRAWIIIPQDVLLTPHNRARLDAYTHGARLVNTVHYWQAAPIDIYLQGE